MCQHKGRSRMVTWSPFWLKPPANLIGWLGKVNRRAVWPWSCWRVFGAPQHGIWERRCVDRWQLMAAA